MPALFAYGFYSHDPQRGLERSFQFCPGKRFQPHLCYLWPIDNSHITSIIINDQERLSNGPVSADYYASILSFERFRAWLEKPKNYPSEDSWFTTVLGWHMEVYPPPSAHRQVAFEMPEMAPDDMFRIAFTGQINAGLVIGHYPGER